MRSDGSSFSGFPMPTGNAESLVSFLGMEPPLRSHFQWGGAPIDGRKPGGGARVGVSGLSRVD